MKIVVFSFLVSGLLLSCKNDSSNSQIDQTSNNLVVSDSVTSEINPEYLYVMAQSGLTLRAFNNLNSERIAKMPYGTKVKVITLEKNLTMDVSGIKGGMNEIEYNQKKGFAFNGYLSKFFPPELDAKIKGYATELQTFFPAVTFSESVGGTASKPTNTETLVLPTQQWHEAFFVAQRLFNFPKEFEFPNPKGNDEEIIKNKKTENTNKISELRIMRKEDVLQKIQYAYEAVNFGYTISITKEGDIMKIEKIETVK